MIEFPCVVYKGSEARIAADQSHYDDYISDGWIHWSETLPAPEVEPKKSRKASEDV